MKGRPLIIGVLGGIASGKSTVARRFGTHGALVIDADRIAHEVLKEPDLAGPLTALLGGDVLGPDGTPDRRRIAKAVFRAADDDDRLRKLEALVHPRVRRRIEEEIERSGAVPAVVLDVPLLIEGGRSEICDVLVFVRAGERLRRERAERDRGWSAAELARRESRQADLTEKEHRADHVVRNEGSLEDLSAAADQLWPLLLEVRSTREERA